MSSRPLLGTLHSRQSCCHTLHWHPLGHSHRAFHKYSRLNRRCSLLQPCSPHSQALRPASRTPQRQSLSDFRRIHCNQKRHTPSRVQSNSRENTHHLPPSFHRHKSHLNQALRPHKRGPSCTLREYRYSPPQPCSGKSSRLHSWCSSRRTALQGLGFR